MSIRDARSRAVHTRRSRNNQVGECRISPSAHIRKTPSSPRPTREGDTPMFRRRPIDGSVTARKRLSPQARLDRAIAAVLEPLERRTLLSVAIAGIPSWTEQGPGPSQGGSGQGIPNQPVTGAIQAVAVHPSDANIIWVGSV